MPIFRRHFLYSFDLFLNQLLNKSITLVLENGSEFQGYSFGAEHSTSGEVVFATGMVGYTESLTDPSYAGQILTYTFPLIGNYGVPSDEKEYDLYKNFESSRIHVRALVVSDYSFEYSHWNAKQSLSEWLKKENIPAVYGIDTRRLTKTLREQGTMLGKIIFEKEETDFYDPNAIDIVQSVTVEEPILYNKNGKKKIILIDCGAKNNIVRNFIKRNISILRVPYDYDFSNESFDGVMISNGPGNPKMNGKTISHIRKTIEQNIPTFGICLGNQLLALAAGGNTYKLRYGHRSQNQPCTLVGTKRCYITTQNHGFAVDMKSLNNEWEEFYVNSNDGTNEGLKHKTKPCFSVQFHPEHTPGPFDTEFLFDEFISMLK
ncbi:MAG: glutamine-hydrolyzing carbamoyl-phosphate synthase small subunit [Ignavibacteria bacterium]|nr:glutamine-hydrolyzing carbamoyl-phosphate synthase small subunit [Ignavibacteria bacterium]